MVDTTFWKVATSGPTEGCTVIVAWGDLWPIVIPLYLSVVFGAVVIAAKMSFRGYRLMGFCALPVALVLGISLIGAPHCSKASAGLELTYWSNWVMLGFVALVAAFLRTQRDSALCPGGWASALVYTKVASPSNSPFFRRDFMFVGPLNEFLSMTLGEAFVWMAVIAWLAVAFADKYMNLTADPPTMNSGYETLMGNKCRAAGKAFAQVAARAIFLSVLSPTRNVVLYQLFGVPFDRGIKMHKMAGRLMLMSSYLHVAFMLAGGTTTSVTKWSDKFNFNKHNNWPGPVALFAWTMLVVTSLPFFRRFMFEKFYFLHLNFWFLGNLFTVLHDRRNVVVWVVASVVTLWLDFAIRWYTKLAKKSELISFEVVADNLAKMVLRRDGPWPGGAFDFHPGSYIWISVDVPSAKRTAKLMPKIEVPGGPPGGVPSFLWFHPMTVSSFDPATNHLTVFVKRMGEGEAQWSGQVIATLKAVQASELTAADVRVHIGGPNGSLQVDPGHMDHVVLTSGGIGVTPMAAILEDRVRKAAAGALAKNAKTTFLWTTRAADEIAAFAYLFNSVAALPAKERALFDIRVFRTGASAATDAEAGALPKDVVTVTSGRPVFAAIVAEIVGGDAAGAKVGVYTCGPEALADACENAAIANGCFVHRETFEF